MAQNTRTLRSISRLSPVVLAGFFAIFSFVSVAWASSISSSEVIKLANEARIEAGLAPLAENQKLSQAAREKAEDMLKKDYFAHTSPEGVTPWSWIKGSGYQYKAAGENLAINYTSAKDQHSAWMKSPSHRANIINAQYREIGVATVKGKIDGKESVVTVEFFGTPLAAVADKQAPVVPPVAQKQLAEIKGVQTPTEIPAPAFSPADTSAFPIPDVSLMPQVPAENLIGTREQIPASVPLNMSEIAFIAALFLVSFSVIAPAALFLYQAQTCLRTAFRP